ncbi:hypothetical protein FO519_008313, partial [Halicephalobus sp. NKZ332]
MAKTSSYIATALALFGATVTLFFGSII